MGRGGWVKLCLAGQTWGLDKIGFGQVWDWVGLG